MTYVEIFIFAGKLFCFVLFSGEIEGINVFIENQMNTRKNNI